MKAVLWTDTLQLLIMFEGVITVFTAGVIQEGGYAKVTKLGQQSGRLDVFEYVSPKHCSIHTCQPQMRE